MGICSLGVLLIAAVAAPADAPVELGAPYVDGQVGFSIRPPVGAALVRHTPDEPAQQPDLFLVVSFPLVERKWNLAVEMMMVPPAQTVSDTADRVIATTVERLGLTLQSRRKRSVGGRDAVVVSAAGAVSGGELHFSCAVIEATESKRFAVELTGPAGQADALTATFAVILDGFQVLISPDQEAALRKASQAGVRLLKLAVAEGLDSRLEPEQYHRFVKDGKDIGFTRIAEQPQAVRHSVGVQVSQSTWLFDPSDAVKRSRSSLFVSNDLTKERWTVRGDQIIPAQDGKSRRYAFTEDRGLAQHDKLVVSVAVGPSLRRPDSQVFELPPDYLQRALVHLLPRFLPLDTPATYAFTCHDGQTNSLATLRYELIGKESIELSGKSVIAYRIEYRRGLAGEPAVLWVNRQGRLLRARSGRLETIRAEKPQIELLYQSRCTQAKDELETLARAKATR
jgi:hypothetical protein